MNAEYKDMKCKVCGKRYVTCDCLHVQLPVATPSEHEDGKGCAPLTGSAAWEIASSGESVTISGDPREAMRYANCCIALGHSPIIIVRRDGTPSSAVANEGGRLQRHNGAGERPLE